MSPWKTNQICENNKYFMFAQDPQLKDNLIKLQISGSHNFIAAINNSLGPSVKVPDLILVNAEPGHESL